MADDGDGASADSRGHTRRAILAASAAGAGAGIASALSSSGNPGNLWGGTMALTEAFNVSGDLWIGPDSAKSTVDATDGRVYMASDTQVEYYGDGGAWTKLGVGSSTEPVPSVHTERASINQYLETPLRERQVQYPTEERAFYGVSEDAGYRFEDLTDWGGVSGASVAASTSTVKRGSQSMQVTASADSAIIAERFFSNPLNLQDKAVSFHHKRVKPTSEAVRLRFEVQDTGGTTQAGWVRLPDTTYLSTDWFRYDVTFAKTGNIDLTAIEKIRFRWDVIGGSSVDHEYYVDDLRYQPRGEKGYVTFSFDDANDTDYTEAFSYLENYGYAGVSYVSSDAIGDAGKLSTSQMAEMRDAVGWEFGNHTENHVTGGLNAVSVDEAEAQVAATKEWLLENGFEKGARTFAYPQNATNEDVRRLVAKYHDLGFIVNGRFGTPATTPVTSPTMVSRLNAPRSKADTKDAIDAVAEHGGVLTLAYHDIGTGSSSSVSIADFQEVVDYVEGKGDQLQVITPSQAIPLLTEPPRAFQTRHERDTKTFSGDGATTVFTVSHGLPGAPTHIDATPDLGTAATAIDGYQNVTASSFDVVFSSAPASGTNNVTISYEARL